MKQNFLAFEQENQQLLGDLQQISLEKQQMQQQHGELALCVKEKFLTLEQEKQWFSNRAHKGIFFYFRQTIEVKLDAENSSCLRL